MNLERGQPLVAELQRWPCLCVLFNMTMPWAWEVMVSDFDPSTEYALEAGFHQQVSERDKCQSPLFVIHNFYVYIYICIYINLLYLIVPLEAFYVAVGLQGREENVQEP